MRSSDRRRRGHPWWFMLVAGTMVAALVHGDVALGCVLLLVATRLLHA